MRRVRRSLAASLVAGLLLTAAADAATYRVNKTRDPAPGNCTQGHCTLREAVREANASFGVADKIVLPNRRRAYRLTQPGTGEDGALDGDLDVTDDRLAIIHPGKGTATIGARDTGERLLDAYAPMVLKKLVLTGGEQGEGQDGGAIEAQADLRISRSVLRRNTTDGFGGAISHTGGDLAIGRTKLVGNTALDESGAINATGDRTVIRRSTFAGNRALASQGGVMYASTDLLIEQSTFTGNRTVLRGGAVHIDGGEATIRDSTFSGNRAQENGGAISSYGALEITNSTFWRNRAAGDGGAIWNGGTAAINATTVARNVSNSDNDLSGGAGGGIYNSGGFDVEIANTVLALNVQIGGDADQCSGTFASQGGNLRTDGAGCGGFTAEGDAIRADPRIGRLARNGGPTQTIELRPESPAIGRAIEALAPDRDQRGRQRDGNPDSGAYERGA